MLRARFLFLTSLVLATMATAQNLVPNPSFEDTVDCETPTQCQLLKATHWRNPNTATPDVWDADLVRECGFPMDSTEIFGYQAPFHGSRCSGLYFWFGPGSSDTREYLMIQLTSSLTSGSAYRVGLNYSRRDDFKWATDHIGVWLGTDSVFENTPNWLSLTPQVRLYDPNSPYLSEADLWVELADTLFAQGGEHWMIIGNFDVADSVNGIQVIPVGWSYAYYYIDQVSLVHLGEVQALPEPLLQVQLIAGSLQIQLPFGFQAQEITVRDVSGRSVLTQPIRSASSPIQVDLEDLSAGIYVLTAVGGACGTSVRFVKEE
ncbi:MAG: T9SS type A sorting domain-containing protein [Flavobacteriales bacterium]|nr:T9SS type A sorting domain-containing protein [Flavobacteriales bacterium]